MKKTVGSVLKRMFCFAVTLVVAVSSVMVSVNAADTNETNNSANVVTIDKDQYTPVHVAVLMDASQSIEDWHGETVSRRAAWRFINKLIGTDNKVSIYRYDEKVERLTIKERTDNLASLKKLRDVMMNDTKLRKSTYTRTALIKAVDKASEDLKNESEEGVKNVIILFTDGSDNGTLDEDVLSKDKQPAAIKTAINKALDGKKDNLIIYSVAYDYVEKVDQDGDGIADVERHSVGADEDGFGALIVKELAAQTNGDYMFPQDGELNEKFSELINNLLFSGMKPMGEIEGDGKKHEVPFEIGPAVVKASIILNCDDVDALSKCNITLNYDDGTDDTYKNIVLKDFNSNDKGDIWRTDDTITMDLPKPGKWTLTVEGLVSADDIEIKLLEGYDITSRSEFKLMRGGVEADINNPQSGDKLEIHTKLYSDGREIDNPSVYTHESLEARVYFYDEKLFDENYTRNHTVDKLVEDLDSLGLDYKTASYKNGELVLDNVPVNWSGTKYVTIFVFSKQLDIRCSDNTSVTVGTSAPVVIDQLEPVELTTSSLPWTQNKVSKCFSAYSKIDAASISGYDSNVCSVEYSEADDTLSVTPLAIGSTEFTVMAYSTLDSSLEPAVMTVKVNVSNSAPTIELPADEKTKTLYVGDEVKLQGISSYGLDIDGDSLTYSVSLADEAVEYLDAEYDDKTDELTLTAKAEAPSALTVKVDVFDGQDHAFDTIKVEVTNDPNPESEFRLILPEEHKNLKLVLKKDKDTHIIKNVKNYLKGKHGEPVELYFELAEVDNAEVTYDKETDTLTIKALKKTDDLISIKLTAFDGKKTTPEEIIVLKIKKPFPVKVLFIVGGIAAVVAVLGAVLHFLRKEGKKCVDINIMSFEATIGANQVTLIRGNLNVVNDLDLTTKKVTLKQIVEALATTRYMSNDGIAAIRRALGNVSDACNSVVFNGGMPGDDCLVTVSGSHNDIKVGNTELGESISESITKGIEKRIKFTVYSGGNISMVLNFIFK